MTEAEFEAFLVDTSKSGSTSGTSYRSALLWAQRVANVPTFASLKKFQLACRSIKSKRPVSEKGTITLAQLEELCRMMDSWKETSEIKCKTCKCNSQTLRLWIRFQFHATLRPGELELLQRDSLISTTEVAENDDQREAHYLLFGVPRKNARQGGKYRIDAHARALFVELRDTSDYGKYLVPKCADRHIGQLMQVASVRLQWNPQLVWVAHSIRHSAFTELKSKVQVAVNEFVAQVTNSTFQVYTNHKTS
jgi:hypothetical protein